MERRGFVTSYRDPSDGRGRLIVLTATGHAVRYRVVARRRAAISERLERLPVDPGLRTH